MTSDALLVVRFLFSALWQFFNGFYFPGTNVTPAAMFFFILLGVFVLRLLRYILNKDVSDGGGKDG